MRALDHYALLDQPFTLARLHDAIETRRPWNGFARESWDGWVAEPDYDATGLPSEHE